MSIRKLLSGLLFVSLVAGVAAPWAGAVVKETQTHTGAKSSKKKHSTKSAKSGRTSSAKSKAAAKKRRAADLRRLRRMNKAFVASADLKPMARQLLQARTRAAYNGVEAYARRHAGTDAGSMANLVLGYAHILDRDYEQAIAPLKKARTGELGDYSDYFLATAYGGTGQAEKTVAALKDFEANHGDSLFLRDAVVIYAEALTAVGRPQDALAELEKYKQPERADVNLTMAHAYMKAGDSGKAAELLRRIYVYIPQASEAAEAKVNLDSLATAGGAMPPSFAERKTRADLLARSGRWSDAAAEYRTLLAEAGGEDRPAVQAALGMALHRTGKNDEARELLESLPDVAGDHNAQALLALAEIARSNGDEDRLKEIVSRLRQNYSTSSYFEDALLLGGNMYLLKPDYDRAIDYYRELQQRFPTGRRGAYAHWKTAWLNFRQGRKDEAKKLFEEQLDWYPTSAEVSAAIYWRARIAEDEGDRSKAAAWYAKLADSFHHYYYAELARGRIAQLGSPADPPQDPVLQKVPAPVPPAEFASGTPVDDLRAQKARLLENAGMIDFAAKELRTAVADGGAGWATREIARMYRDLGKYDRALQTLKRAVPSYYSLEIESLPREAWEGLFPKPYWTDLRRYSQENGLDPFLVASLIRQESEFNPGAVSNANAYGLMQLLPGTGRTVARTLRVRRFQTTSLLSPTTNLQLGTRYFRELVDRYNGRLEYALAAYNAGANRVDAWLADGKFRDTEEFVESIPFTETREYVQAILRNATVYRRLYGTP